jgi:hypothetical protein
MKKVGFILVFAVLLLAIYTLALAQYEIKNARYLGRTTAEFEIGGL